MNQFEILRTIEFIEWFSDLTIKEQAQVDIRIAYIEESGHFGDCKYLGKGLAELRWKNGRRVYFARINNQIILLLIGGVKNAQIKDIKKARFLLIRYAGNET